MMVTPSVQKLSRAPMSTFAVTLKMRSLPRMSFAPVIHGCVTPASTHGESFASENGHWPSAGFFTNFGLKVLPLMRGRSVRQANVVMEPLSVVTRESTGYDAMHDPAIARALRFIHLEAARHNIGVGDVVQATGCSRRYVEQHFRSQLNASVRDVILRTKLERVRSLLEESNLSIGEIAAQCGNMNESHLAVLFKKATGLSMSDYRKQNREPPDD